MGQLFGKASLEDLIYSTLLNYFLYFLKLLFKPKLAQSFNLNRNIYLVRIKMREKRTISVRHPQLVRFRNALREVLSTAKSIEYRRLLDEGRGLRPTVSEGDAEKRGELSDKQHRLETAWNKSLCVCSLCGSRTSNMTFNPYMEEWFCVDCYEKNQEFYKAEAREGQIWNSENYARTPSTEWWP